MSAPTSTSPHRWKFFRSGGLDQVALETGDDLLNLKFLDQKLWVALSCPVKGLELDEKTLELIDTDKDGRIQPPELLGAVEWAAARLKKPGDLIQPNAALPLSAIDDSTPEGKAILSSAAQIVLNLGKSGATEITPVDTAEPQRIFANSKFNGDGIITGEASDDPEVRLVIADIVATLGPEMDRSGKPGVNQAKVDQFYGEVAAHLDWLTKGTTPEIAVLGAETAAAYGSFRVVRSKIDDFFARCSLAAFDARAIAALNRHESEYLSVAAKDLTITSEEIAAFPLARIEANRGLPLQEGLNPAWADAVGAFRRLAVSPLLGTAKIELTAAEWRLVKEKFSGYEGWLASKAGAALEKLGVERVRKLAAENKKSVLTALIAQDKALETEARAIADVERLVRYYRDLHLLLRNFVNFSDFYNPHLLAIFQNGTLYLDSRSCELCMRVDDPASHSILATLSKIYIAYCDLKRANGETMKIAACFTQGESDYLMVGRNGLFYDRKGRTWHATISKIVDHPISLRQAFWSPYKKFVRAIEDQVAKRAAEAEKRSDALLVGTAANIAQADKQKQAAEPKRIDVGSVAAMGVAFGALGTAFGYFLGLFKGLQWWQFPLLIGGIILLISLPSVAIAWLKLRQRTLGPVLDANGWAINGRVKINIPFGTRLTARALLPPGAKRSLDDPFEDKEAKRRKWMLFTLVLVVSAYLIYAALQQRFPFQPGAPRTEQKAESPGKPASEPQK